MSVFSAFITLCILCQMELVEQTSEHKDVISLTARETRPVTVCLSQLNLLKLSPRVSFSPTPVLDVQSPLDAQINLKLQNLVMLLKRCCNHPYLVEYPLDPATQDFKVTTVTLLPQVLFDFGFLTVCDSRLMLRAGMVRCVKLEMKIKVEEEQVLSR